MHIPLDLQQYALVEKVENGKRFCFDPLRKKWLSAGPEELVRQQFISFLVNELKYPRGLIKVEHPLTFNKLSHRSDIVLYNRSGKPLMIVECKAPNVPITQDTMNQASRYNITLHVKYLAVTNGLQTFCCEVDYENGKTIYMSSFSAVLSDL